MRRPPPPRQRPAERNPLGSAPKVAPYQAKSTGSRTFLEDLAAEALPGLELKLSAAKREVEHQRLGAKHTPHAFNNAVANHARLSRLVERAKEMHSRAKLTPHVPEPALISILAETVNTAIERGGLEQLASLVTARMPKVCKLPPHDTANVLRALRSLENIWKGDTRR